MRQTLVQAVFLATSGHSRTLTHASWVLDGKPPSELDGEVGAVIKPALPVRDHRAYTIGHFVDAFYSLTWAAGSIRYIRRSDAQAQRIAAEIEAGAAVEFHLNVREDVIRMLLTFPDAIADFATRDGEGHWTLRHQVWMQGDELVQEHPTDSRQEPILAPPVAPYRVIRLPSDDGEDT